ncbi:MAG: T9SS type B sorting domain-containing protein [Flavobacterium sp.]|nr:MAG: T9SS type B sorting domain-containing protein [Flavobacterium sp.]
MQTRFYLQMLLIATLFLVQDAYGQLSGFTLSVTTTAETCNGNGTLTMTTTGTDPAASVIFTIYQLPDMTTPIAVTADTDLGGLVAGTYFVVATQSLGGEINSQEQTAVIVDQTAPLQFTLSAQKAICGNDGKITVNVTQGTAVSYEIFSGPEIAPLQASNMFTGLVTGTYQVRVFDGCGDGYVQSINVGQELLNITFRLQSVTGNCTQATAIDYLESFGGTIIAYPITVVYTLTAGTSVTQYSQTLTSGSSYSEGLIQNFPLFYDQACNYFITVTDACGNVYTSPPRYYYPHFTLWVGLQPVSCTDRMLEVRLNNFGTPPFTVAFLSAPAGFDPLVYNSNHPGPFATDYASYHNNSVQLPVGFYTIKVTDSCGRTDQQTIYVDFPPLAVGAIEHLLREGCDQGFGSVELWYPPGGIYDIKIVSAPAAYPNALPDDIFDGAGNFIGIGPLPAGTYVFDCEISCNQHVSKTIVIQGYSSQNNSQIIEHCGSFDIDLDYVTPPDDSNPDFYLQKLDANNQWITIAEVQNGQINYNFQSTGTFRILKEFYSYLTDGGVQLCSDEVMQFEFLGTPRLNDVYSFSCDNGTYDVILEADGVAPFLYRIVEKDGLPFVVQNGNSAVFLGLSPATYVFQVEDSCGNIINRTFDIPQPFDFGITATLMCTGEPGSISAPGFGFLNYEWYSDANPTVILSTTASLLFPSYQNSNDGLYHVHISYTGSAASCIDFIADYQLNGSAMAQAGQDVSVSYCGPQGILDLSALLSSAAAVGGNWSAAENGSQLNGSNWDSSNVAPGVYNFVYSIANCSATDSATISITIEPKPQTPAASVQQNLCARQDIQLFSSQITGATYQWNGPNGFVSSNQNPIIQNANAQNAGIYTVQAYLGDCVSDQGSVEIVIGDIPPFTISAICVDNRMMMSATTADLSSDYSFSWTGPNNFLSSQNPTDISGNAAGSYSLTVTNAEGCTATFEQDIAVTLCQIPHGVSVNGDGANDSFDLSGFGENLKVKIFNRYGMVVYEMNNYVDQWHGQCKNGSLLPSATYYYLIQGDAVPEKTGWVYLMRKD